MFQPDDQLDWENSPQPFFDEACHEALRERNVEAREARRVRRSAPDAHERDGAAVLRDLRLEVRPKHLQLALDTLERSQEAEVGTAAARWREMLADAIRASEDRGALRNLQSLLARAPQEHDGPKREREAVSRLHRLLVLSGGSAIYGRGYPPVR